MRLDAWCEGRLALHAEIEWGDETHAEPCRLSMHPYSAHDRKPRILERSDLSGRAGSVALWVDGGATASEFPDLVARTGLRTATELLTLTRLVGMHCPGLRSIFSGFELERRPSFLPPDAWRYAVDRVLPGTSLVQIEVESTLLAGRLDTFLRPAPQPQPSYMEVKERVQPGEFAGQRDLPLLALAASKSPLRSGLEFTHGFAAILTRGHVEAQLVPEPRRFPRQALLLVR